MYAVRDMRRFRDSLGASPAILATASAVALTSAFASVVGLLPGAGQQTATTPGLAPQAGATAEPADRTAPHASPARDVVVSLLGEQPRWGAVIPVGFGCTLPAPTLSAESGGVSVHVFGPGLGGVVADTLAGCGTRARLGEIPAVTIPTDTGRLTAWTRGDVLVTLVTADAPGSAATDLDARLLAALEPVCVDLAPDAEAITRNPTQGSYAPFTEQVIVSVPELADPPDVGAAPAQVAPADPGRPTVPQGLVGPPLPEPVTRPSAPTWPGPMPLVTDVTVPAVDQEGPGCGWAFTGAVPPPADAGAIRAQKTQAMADARSQLLAHQSAWATAAADYPAALEAYQVELAGWQAYVTAHAAVTDAWAEQSRALAAYQQELAAYDAAVTDREQFLADQAAAQDAYDRAVARCTASQNPDAEPGAGGRPPRGCATPPERPAILDQPTPPVPAVPAPPVLWKAGDPIPTVPAHP